MNYPTKKRRLISPLYLCYGNSFVYAADQLLFDISVIFLQRLLLVVFSPHSFLPMWQHPSDTYTVILHFIYSQNHTTHVKFNKAPASNKVTYIPSDSLIPEPFMLPLSRTNEKRQASTVQSRPVFLHTAPGVKLPCALTSI